MATLDYPPPLNHQDLETLTVLVAEYRLPGSRAVPHGRNGQAQQGIDVVVTLHNGSILGAQCKWKARGTALTIEEVIEECEKAKAFRPQPVEVIVCTTAQPDANLQREVRALDYSFSVDVWAWDTYNDTLNRAPELARTHQERHRHLDRRAFEEAHAGELREALDRAALTTPIWAEGSFSRQLTALDKTLAFLRTGRLYDHADELVRATLPMDRFDGAYFDALIGLDASLKRMRTLLLRHAEAVRSSEFGFSHETAGPVDEARNEVVAQGEHALGIATKGGVRRQADS